MHRQLGDVCARVHLAHVVDRATDALLRARRNRPEDDSNHYGVVRGRVVEDGIGNVREEELTGFTGLAKHQTLTVKGLVSPPVDR
jgi:hypothetical protein